MDPFSAITGIISLLTGLGGLAASGSARKRVEDFSRPGGAPGTLTQQQAGGLDLSAIQSMFGAGPNTDAITQQLRAMTTNVPGGTMALAGEAENQRVLAQQRPFAEDSLNQVKTGGLSQASTAATDLMTRNPEVIDQATYDRMVGQFFDQNNAGAASRSRQIDDSATAGNISPDALAALRVMSSEENAAQNQGASRDLAITRQLENRKGLERAIAQAGSLGQAYNQQLGAANADVAGTYQPVDFDKFASLIGQDAYTKLGLMSESDQALANMLLGISGGALNSFTADRNSRRQSQLAQAGGGFGWESLLAPYTAIPASLANGALTDALKVPFPAPPGIGY